MALRKTCAGNTSANKIEAALKTSRAGAGRVPLRVGVGPNTAVAANASSGWVVTPSAGAARVRIGGRAREEASCVVVGVVVGVGVRASGRERRFADGEIRHLRYQWVGSPPRSVLCCAALRVLQW